MRLQLKLALSALLLGTLCGIAQFSGAEPPRNTTDARGTSLLSPDQGQALADFARQQRSGLYPKPDCSHLVHRIYSQAGLNYAYAGSRDLYNGNDDFERVSHPQPGDLVVWKGHVGIVVDPGEKTFFSSVRSGMFTEAWDAGYWRQRGHPRFLRYRMGPAADKLTLVALAPQKSASDDVAANNLAVNILAVNKEDVSVTQLAPVPHTARPNAQTPSKNIAQPGFRQFKAAAQTPTATAVGSTNAKPVPSSASSNTARPSRTVSPQLPPAPVEPPLIAVIRQRAKPSKQDVAAALTQSNIVRAQKFSTTELFYLVRPVSVVERVEVQKVKIKNDEGTVELKLTETLSLDGNKVNPAKTLKRDMSINRRGDTWVISDPQARCFIPQEQAVRVFERQTELFLRQNPSSTSTRTIVKALDVLFDRETASAQRAAIR